jgi:isocitrate dehydrogenase (NAD+)
MHYSTHDVNLVVIPQKVTCIHKANIMKLGDGLFLNTFRKVAEEYKSTDIEANDMIIDNTCVIS